MTTKTTGSIAGMLRTDRVALARLVALAVLVAAALPATARPATAARADDFKPPAREKFKLFLLVGQSNMAGRGKVEDVDRKAHPRVVTLSKENTWAPAVDPIHFDKPTIAGVGPGATFGKVVADADPSITLGEFHAKKDAINEVLRTLPKSVPNSACIETTDLRFEILNQVSCSSMQADISKVLITEEQIADRVQALAERITRDHTPAGSDETPEVTIVPVLTGAMIFCSDLIRRIGLRMKIGLITVSSYPGASLSTQGPQLLGSRLGDVRGRHVVIVDDILDSGGTLKLIVPTIRDLGAASVRTCVLLRKNRPEARAFPADYWGFEIPDEFVVGYGLDYNDYYRNLPYIGTLSAEAIERGRE